MRSFYEAKPLSSAPNSDHRGPNPAAINSSGERITNDRIELSGRSTEEHGDVSTNDVLQKRDPPARGRILGQRSRAVHTSKATRNPAKGGDPPRTLHDSSEIHRRMVRSLLFMPVRAMWYARQRPGQARERRWTDSKDGRLLVSGGINRDDLLAGTRSRPAPARRGSMATRRTRRSPRWGRHSASLAPYDKGRPAPEIPDRPNRKDTDTGS